MSIDLNRITKKYPNDKITVVWKPGKCIHSKICFSGLPSVFNPAKRPWIEVSGSTTQRIIAQVEKCPSGALSYYHNESDAVEQKEEKHIGVVVESKPEGPLFVYGDFDLKLPDGTVSKRTGATAFCRCGNSANKPYCDGSHLKAGFKG